MPAINFSAEFADAVESGKKSQTIRKRRKCPIKAGDRLQLYAGQRTKACRKLGEGVCDRVIDVIIDRTRLEWGHQRLILSVGGITAQALAQADGFQSYDALCDWFDARYGLPFTGVVIQWEKSDD